MSLTPSTLNPQSATYQASFNVTAPVGQFATLLGSATTTVFITKIYFSTPGGALELQVIKQSSATTGGTSTVLTGVPLSSTNAAATAVARQYTVAPTPGAAVGTLVVEDVATTDRVTYEYGTAFAQPITLRGAAQQIALVSSVSTAVQGFIQWYEIAS